MVRAKFTCVSKTEHNDKTKSVTLSAVIGNTPEATIENKEFWKWTPSGKLEMQCLLPETADKFETGKEYYLDFTPVN